MLPRITHPSRTHRGLEVGRHWLGREGLCGGPESWLSEEPWEACLQGTGWPASSGRRLARGRDPLGGCESRPDLPFQRLCFSSAMSGQPSPGPGRTKVESFTPDAQLSARPFYYAFILGLLFFRPASESKQCSWKELHPECQS